MRQGRAPSRSATRTKGSSPSPSLANAAAKKSTKLPQIMGVADDGSLSNGNGQPSSGLIVGVCSQQGKRPYQEDEYSIRQFLNQSSPPSESETNVETHFFGLFDGHAGGRCSNYVAGSLGNVLAEDAAFFTNLPQALKRSFHATNEMFLKVAEKMKYHDGSTGITAVVRDSKVLVANVGDCRCLIISGGRPIQMSIDQKPTNPEEQKRIVALGGTVVYCMGVARVNRVLAVSRAFGNRTLRTVIRPDAEMMQRELTRDDDYIVMASDGLWDVLKNKDVCDMCYSPFTQSNPQAIADELVQTALMRGSMDNVTCIVVKLTDYVQRLFGNRSGGAGASANGSAGANPSNSALPSASTHSGSQQAAQLFSNNSNPNALGAVGMLERSSSLKNVAGSGRMSGADTGYGSSSNQMHGGGAGAGSGAAGGGLLPLSRQYSTGSIANNTSSSSANGQLQLQQPQLAPVLDNYLYSPSRGRTSSNGGAESPAFQLPSTGANGRASPGIATLRQHMHRDGSFNFDEDDQTISGSGANYSGSSGGGANSANNSGSGNSWMGQPAVASSPVGSGAGAGGFGASGYAARRPNTMGGATAAGNVLGNNSRSSFSNGMPNLISMFNSSMPQINGAGGGGGGGNGGNSSNNQLAPLPTGGGQMSNSGGAWGNSEGDYSGSSFNTDSSAGSRVATSHGGFQPQRAGAMGTIFPMNYKKSATRK